MDELEKLEEYTLDIANLRLYPNKFSSLAEELWGAFNNQKKFSNAMINIFSPSHANVLNEEEVQVEIVKFTDDVDEQVFLASLFRFFKTSIESTKGTYDICLDEASKIFQFFYYLGFKDKELFKVLYLDNNFFLKKSVDLALGSVNKAILNPIDFFFHAKKLRSTRLVLLHNHPSGNNEPSVEDLVFTREMEKICQKMQVELVDHVIISKEGYFSFREDGLLQLPFGEN